MSVTTEDIQQCVKLIWEEAIELSNPGTGLVKALVMGRVPDGQAAPYTSFKVTDGDVQRTASQSYLQMFAVELKTWDETGAVNAGAIKDAIERAFVQLTRKVFSLPNLRTLKVLHIVKIPGALEEDTATQQGQAVKVSTDRFEFLCQG